MPSWGDYTSDTYWTPAFGTWDGSKWTSGDFGGYQFFVATPGAFATGYGQTQLRVTFTAVASLDYVITVGGSNETGTISSGVGFSIGSGDISFVQFGGTETTFTITKIEFYPEAESESEEDEDMATADDLITAAYRKVGVENPTDTHKTHGLTALNNMLGTWGADRLVHVVTRESFLLSSASSEYTIGSGGNLNTVRPNTLENIYLKDTEGYDHPVDIIAATDYNDVSYKAFSTRPLMAYFVPEWPLAKIIFDSKPDAAYTACCEFAKPWTEFAATSASLSAPPEYKESIIYNLAIALAEDWDRIIPKTVLAKAEQCKEILKRLLAAIRKTPKAKFNIPGRRSTYKITIDE